MTQQYRLGFIRRAANVFMRALLALRVPVPHTYLLAVRGRRTGVLRKTPVTLVEDDRGRFLVAPYGDVNWVRNARSAGKVQLRHGSRWRTAQITELSPKDAAPILKTYITQVRIVRPYFDVTPASSIPEFEREAPRHPVFRITDGAEVAA
jgi:deazaflavin-dependent oxidoreductase (nitroreductase family)